MTSKIAKLIEKAGMEVVVMKDADTDGDITKESERIYVVAKEVNKKV